MCRSPTYLLSPAKLMGMLMRLTDWQDEMPIGSRFSHAPLDHAPLDIFILLKPGQCHTRADISVTHRKMNPAKTELIWAGSKYNISMLGNQAPALQLGSDTETASDHVRELGVTFSSDLGLEKHVSKTCAVSFHWLRQLYRIRKSLDDESAATLVHAFVTSRVDYCNAVYAGAPKTITDKL